MDIIMLIKRLNAPYSVHLDVRHKVPYKMLYAAFYGLKALLRTVTAIYFRVVTDERFLLVADAFRSIC